MVYRPQISVNAINVLKLLSAGRFPYSAPEIKSRLPSPVGFRKLIPFAVDEAY